MPRSLIIGVSFIDHSRTVFNTYVAKLPTIRQEAALQAQAPEEAAALPETYETGENHAA